MDLGLKLLGQYRLLKVGEQPGGNGGNDGDVEIDNPVVEIVVPEAEPVTASAQDILTMQAQGTLRMVSTATVFPEVIPVGTSSFDVGDTHVVVSNSGDGGFSALILGDESTVGRKHILDKIENLLVLDQTVLENPIILTSDDAYDPKVNGEIDEPVAQGNTGDCWLVAGVLALNTTEVGRQIIKDSIKVNQDGSVTVTFKGFNPPISYTISSEEIARHDTDTNTSDAYSNGDNDMLVLELAVEKLRIDIENGVVEIDPSLGYEYTSTTDYEELGVRIGDPGAAITGGFEEQLIYFLTGIVSETAYPNITDDATVEEIRVALATGLPAEDVLKILQEAYENGNTCLSFGIYGGPGIDGSCHSAMLVDGSSLTAHFERLSEWGGHALTITNLTENTVTFIDPNEPSVEYTMTWEEFAKFGIGCFTTADLSDLAGVSSSDPIEPEVPVTPEPEVPETSPETPTSGLTKEEYQVLVNKYIDVYVNDFKTNYARYGLDTAPTDAEVSMFKNRLTELCANGVESLMNAKADEASVQSWVQKQCAVVANEILDARKPLVTDSITSEKAIGLIQDAINEVIEEKLDNIAGGNSKIHTEFGVDKDGNIIFQNEKTKDVYENLAKYVKSEISKIESYGKYSGILDAIGGEAVLDSLIQTAWMATYNTFNSSSSHNTENFIKEVLNNLNRILDKVAKSPETLEYFTGRGCYADSTITNGVTHYGTETTYGNDEVISYKGDVTVYEDGTVHISNNKDDNDYQVTMSEILANIKAKYSDIDEKFLEEIFRDAQKAALEAAQGNRADCPYGTGNNKGRVGDQILDWSGKDSRNNDGYKIHMDQLVQLTLYYFDKKFIEKCITTEIPPRDTTKVTSDSPVAESPNSNPTEAFSNAVNCTIFALDEVLDEKLDNIAGGLKKIHTEFGIDNDGKIVFQEGSTQRVYTDLVKYIKNEIRSLEMFGKFETILKDLGGDAVLESLIQAAWIDSYNRFDSSTSHNTEAFLAEVIQNLQEILRAVQAHPERLQFYTMHTAYADTTLTDGLTHYNTKTTHGNDETISYKGNVTTYDDGSVHIANDKDDADYQATMNGLLVRLKNKYSAYGDITSIFREAQKAALEAAQGNRRDCPYGTGGNDGRVENATRDWGGSDSRSGDGYKIHMDQLVQLTLYYFDKLFYQALKEE